MRSLSGTTIKALLLLIGALAYFGERMYKFISIYNAEYEEIALIHTYTISTDTAFELKDFVFAESEFNTNKENKVKAIALYPTIKDSISMVGIEIKDRSKFIEDLAERGKIIVKPGGGTWQLPTYKGNRLFGFEYKTTKEYEDYKRLFGAALFDDNITKRIMLTYIPYEKPSRYLPELGILSVVIIGLTIVTIAGLMGMKDKKHS